MVVACWLFLLLRFHTAGGFCKLVCNDKMLLLGTGVISHTRGALSSSAETEKKTRTEGRLDIIQIMNLVL
jgi:hypothetical protein